MNPRQAANRVLRTCSLSISVRIGGLAWLALVAGPGPAEALTQAELNAGRALWDAQGIVSYDYFMQRSCFCEPSTIRPGIVQVRDESILAVTDAETLVSLDPQYFATVNGLFDRLQAALDDNVFEVTASFDAQLGYPQSIFIDVYELAVDDTLSFVARDLAVIPEPAAAILSILSLAGVAVAARRRR